MDYDCQLYVKSDSPKYEFIVEMAAMDGCFIEVSDKPNVTTIEHDYTLSLDYSFVVILIVLLWFYLINSGKI